MIIILWHYIVTVVASYKYINWSLIYLTKYKNWKNLETWNFTYNIFSIECIFKCFALCMSLALSVPVNASSVLQAVISIEVWILTFSEVKYH